MSFLAELVPLLLAVLGSTLGGVVKFVASRDITGTEVEATTSSEHGPLAGMVRHAPPRKPPMPPGQRVLLAFACLVILFGALAAWRYWPLLRQHADLVFFAGGLFLTMVGGMFVQVIVANYKAGSPLFDVTASQLIFPLLFSIIVFYPIWAVGTDSERSFFAFYAAFLNGYFWETVVASAKPPAPTSTGG